MCPVFAGGWFGGGMPMMIMMAIFWGLVIWGAFVILRKVARSGQEARTVLMQSPIEIAKERYARGEISQEEFERMKQDLNK